MNFYMCKFFSKFLRKYLFFRSKRFINDTFKISFLSGEIIFGFYLFIYLFMALHQVGERYNKVKTIEVKTMH